MRVSGIPGIKVPKIYWEFSGKCLLAMEFVSDVRSDDVDAIVAMGMDPKDLANRGLKAFMVQIFQNGFYHGDPHAGNIHVSPKGDLVFLDFGVCGVLMKDTRNKFISLMLALFAADTDLTIRYVKNLGVKIPSSGLDEFRGELYLRPAEQQGHGCPDELLRSCCGNSGVVPEKQHPRSLESDAALKSTDACFQHCVHA